uniref:Putative secreted protein n=1 Tax=Anopheles darlingi TaxID=43151 RepID=A0A2M4D6H2_ANODA
MLLPTLSISLVCCCWLTAPRDPFGDCNHKCLPCFFLLPSVQSRKQEAKRLPEIETAVAIEPFAALLHHRTREGDFCHLVWGVSPPPLQTLNVLLSALQHWPFFSLVCH